MKPDFHAINRGLLFHSGIRRWKAIKHKAVLKAPLEHININKEYWEYHTRRSTQREEHERDERYQMRSEK